MAIGAASLGGTPPLIWRKKSNQMIRVNADLTLDENELRFEFIQAGGPGGQNVNKVATAVQLRFAVRSPSLPAEVQERLRALAGKRLTAEDEILIEARRFRSQELNRQEAVHRLLELIRQAARRPKPRRKTRPTLAAQHNRLREKRRRGEIKRLRRHRDFLDES